MKKRSSTVEPVLETLLAMSIYFDGHCTKANVSCRSTLSMKHDCQEFAEKFTEAIHQILLLLLS